MDYEQKSKKVEEERRFVESKNNEEFKEFYYSLFGLAVADSLTDNKDYKKMFKEYSNYMSKIDDSAMPITKEQGVKEDVNTIITGVIEGTGVYKHVGVELAENIKDVVNVSDKLEDSIKIDDKEETKKNMLKLSIKLYELREKLEERLKNAIDKEEHEKIKQAIERIDELQKRLKVSAPKVAMS